MNTITIRPKAISRPGTVNGGRNLGHWDGAIFGQLSATGGRERSALSIAP